jgi:hypothetical protein
MDGYVVRALLVREWGERGEEMFECFKDGIVGIGMVII